MDGRRCFIRMVWKNDEVLSGWTTLFLYRRNDVVCYKDGWMEGRRCFIRMGGWTDDVVL